MNRVSFFTKLSVIALATLTAFTLLWRDHIFIGSFLSFARWPLLVLLLFYFFRTLKTRGWLQLFKFLCVISIVVLIGEYSHIMLSSYKLYKGETNKKLTLLSYNLYFKNQSKESSIKRIKKENADILVLQEITPSWNSILENHIAPMYPHKEIIVLNGTHGTGIYSKYPIENHNVLKNSSKLPIAQVATIKLDEKKIMLINAHLASPANAVENPKNFLNLYTKNYAIRKSQFDRINTLAVETSSEFDCQILIGDLNTITYEPIFRDLRYYWHDMNNSSLFLHNTTFPNTENIPPIVCLDYIMLRGRIKVDKISVLEGGGSDHLAVTGTVRL